MTLREVYDKLSINLYANPIDSEIVLYDIRVKKIREKYRLEIDFLSTINFSPSKLESVTVQIKTQDNIKDFTIYDFFLRKTIKSIHLFVVIKEIDFDFNLKEDSIRCYEYKYNGQTFYFKDKIWARFSYGSDQMNIYASLFVFEDDKMWIFPKIERNYWQCGCGRFHSKTINECPSCLMNLNTATLYSSKGIETCLIEKIQSVEFQTEVNETLDQNVERYVQKFINYGLSRNTVENSINKTNFSMKYYTEVNRSKIVTYITEHPIQINLDFTMQNNINNYALQIFNQGFTKELVSQIIKMMNFEKIYDFEYKKHFDLVEERITNDIKRQPIKFSKNIPLEKLIEDLVGYYSNEGYYSVTVIDALDKLNLRGMYDKYLHKSKTRKDTLIFITVSLSICLWLLYMGGML